MYLLFCSYHVPVSFEIFFYFMSSLLLFPFLAVSSLFSACLILFDFLSFFVCFVLNVLVPFLGIGTDDPFSFVTALNSIMILLGILFVFVCVFSDILFFFDYLLFVLFGFRFLYFYVGHIYYFSTLAYFS
jgi:hypothetical protein